MNQLELFKKTVNHVKTTRILYYADFAPDLELRLRQFLDFDSSADLREYFGMYQPVNVSMKSPDVLQTKDFESYYKDIRKPADSYIDHIGVLHVPGSLYHFTYYVSPLRNAENFSDIKNYPYYDYSEYTDEGMFQRVQKAHEEGTVASCWVGHMYEDAWQIRGYEAFLEDLILRPDWCGYILDRIKEKNIIVAKAAAKAGVNVIRTGDDVATQNTLICSPALWRSVMKPRWEEVYQEAKMINKDIQIWYHSDGNISEIVQDLVDIGVTILNPVQPECMDPIKIKDEYGDRITIDGTVGTQSIMPFGSPRQVKDYVADRREALGSNGGLILSPTHVLEPEVPIENIMAFFEACKQ
jgi:uroporphyrinogen decarboxylase